MKTHCFLSMIVVSAFFSSACNSSKNTARKAPGPAIAARQDTPILPAKKGDIWRYQVHLEIPPDVTAPGAAEVDETYLRTRTYLGKLVPAAGLPQIDCFEVIAPNAPAEREFVEIYDDRILMRGSMIMRPETTKPMWLDRAIPFVIAGMKAGTELPEFEAGGGGLTRKTQVVARESITVPAGTFPCIRILVTGKDGSLELRRTTWFSPGSGIIREEKTRYLKDKLLFRETQTLHETTIQQP
ncbi:MAG: hypothetical protein ABI600_20990 [Luteolibacter sp.]